MKPTNANKLKQVARECWGNETKIKHISSAMSDPREKLTMISAEDTVVLVNNPSDVHMLISQLMSILDEKEAASVARTVLRWARVEDVKTWLSVKESLDA